MATYPDFERFNPFRVQRACRESKIGQLDVSSAINEKILNTNGQHGYKKITNTHLGLQVPMDVSKLVKLVDTCKHFTNVESGMLLLEDT